MDIRIKNWGQDYIEKQKKALDSVPFDELSDIIEVIELAHRRGSRILIVGNGGSASNSSHFAVDLGKMAADRTGRNFDVQSLTDNVAWITAIGNDYNYDDIFSRQLVTCAHRNDVLIAISVSGNSQNCVNALAMANVMGLITVAITGSKENEMENIAKYVINVDDTHYGRVEDVQMTILHMICYWFAENFPKKEEEYAIRLKLAA
jgi:D-sedoheptulose 7-phosphate isomerase